ncbi:nuclear transport factor 2 family protein [Kitasatospora aureofaciens]|uniref:nuclear transport factor 2 family protein n=1 Tax=Kitasatospora aureofaciens TaxID=1894 RepID=UPI001C441E24|nr:nuclear transport factor 2 family protein [Kitasatospora aureofaciens]MBV6701048.1 nuclear transport factor 2 family protein [Kitasatospora aureofaciens]
MSPLPDRRTLLRAGLATAVPVAVAAHAAAPAAAEPFALRDEDVARWITAYLTAWQNKDADAAMALFTPDAVYQAVPGVAQQTFQGRAAIGDYWRSVTAAQSDLSARYGRPLVQGNRAVVELWVQLQVPGDGGTRQWITLIETNVLHFEAPGLCSRNVEYWNLQSGKIDPPAGWGR